MLDHEDGDINTFHQRIRVSVDVGGQPRGPLSRELRRPPVFREMQLSAGGILLSLVQVLFV